jgi:hypothetical protein
MSAEPFSYVQAAPAPQSSNPFEDDAFEGIGGNPVVGKRQSAGILPYHHQQQHHSNFATTPLVPATGLTSIIAQNMGDPSVVAARMAQNTSITESENGMHDTSYFDATSATASTAGPRPTSSFSSTSSATNSNVPKRHVSISASLGSREETYFGSTSNSNAAKRASKLSEISAGFANGHESIQEVAAVGVDGFESDMITSGTYDGDSSRKDMKVGDELGAEDSYVATENMTDDDDLVSLDDDIDLGAPDGRRAQNRNGGASLHNRNKTEEGNGDGDEEGHGGGGGRFGARRFVRGAFDAIRGFMVTVGKGQTDPHSVQVPGELGSRGV